MTLRTPEKLPRSAGAPEDAGGVRGGFVEERSDGVPARYRDPLGRPTSRTFARKADAERFVREIEVDVDRGTWIDPRGAEVPLAVWAEE